MPAAPSRRPERKGSGYRPGLKPLSRPPHATTFSAPIISPSAHGASNAARNLAERPPQPFQAAVAVLLPWVPDPNPQGALRVSVCDLPGPDHVPAAGHRLAW